MHTFLGVWISLCGCVQCESLYIRFPLPLWGVCVFLSTPFCLILYLYAQVSFKMFKLFFFFSVSAFFYLFLSLSPRTGSIARWIRVQMLEPNRLGPDLSSATHCVMTLGKFLNISVLQFSHLKYKDNNSLQLIELLSE